MSGEAISSPCLSARGIWKIFGNRPKRALEMADTGASRAEVREATGCTIGARDVSFDAYHGETFVIMGLSGSGKSTLLRCVARLSALSRGSVILEGDDLTAMSEAELRAVRRAKLSMVFQHFGLFWHRRVIDNVAYGLEVQGMDRRTRHSRANEMLGLVGLEGCGNSYPHQLSGGMRQRVLIAMAIAFGPKLLVADEPTTALDVTVQAQILELLEELQADLGMAMVLISHDLGLVATHADRVAVMYAGRVVETAPVSRGFGRSRHPYTRSLYRSIPRLDTEPEESLSAIEGQPPDLARLPPGCAFEPRCFLGRGRDDCRQVRPALEPAGDDGSFSACPHWRLLPMEPDGGGTGDERAVRVPA